MTEKNSYMGQLVFGLDIGTRSIVGTVGYKEDNRFVVVAQRVREHETRAMLDGQIHDIGKVSETIRQVKEELEEAIGRKLTDVCIAAAGRVLRTVNSHVEYPFGPDKEIVSEDIYALTSSAVEKAYEEFLKQQTEEDMKFYCVGYSVVRFYLNGYQMGNLEGHKARTIGVDLIATFLPEDVVDGLYRAVELAGLKVANMTLEPIAAIQVAIPERFRMLNIALIDVGAGTSDISITNDGCIIAYGMIPIAGDALTEVIARHCLVDFATAEKIKRQAGEAEEITYEDIMFLPQKIKSKEVLSVTAPVVEDMARQVADKIKELNGGKSVSAVFVVGGGGKLPGYTEAVARDLDIVPERVALRGEEVMQQIVFEEDTAKDSLLVTPIGICLNFYEQNNNFIFVSFNDRKVKIYDNNRLTVADAAMQAGFPNDGLFPGRGKALQFTVNGKQRIVRGEVGEAAVITVNGQPADIATPIHENDIIRVEHSTAGKRAEIRLSELTDKEESLFVHVKGSKVELPRLIMVNDTFTAPDYSITDGDNVEILNYYPLQKLLQYMDLGADGMSNIYVNHELAEADTKVYENFTVDFVEADVFSSMADGEDGMAAGSGAGAEPEKINVADDSTGEAGAEAEQTAETPVTIVVLVNREPVKLSGKPRYVFVDVFDQIHFDLSMQKGRSIITKLNGRPAQYMEPLRDGDTIEIYWQEI